MRPADQEMTAVEQRVCYSQSPRGRTHHLTQGQRGKHQTWSRGGVGGKGVERTGARALIVVSVGRNMQGRERRFRVG